jgi:ABC-2 type transport system ATP-binding protein
VVPAVDVKGLTKRFGDVVAVDGIDLQVTAGTVHGLLGPNGAGKTTLLAMLFGLVRPDAGSITLLGKTRGQIGTRNVDRVAGFVNGPRFYPYLSGRRNLELLAALDGGPARNRIDEVLDVAGLTGRAADKVRGYSLGMRQRLGIAAALLRDPELLVIDEPTNGLDPAGMRDMRDLIRGLAGDGRTVLLSSHNMAEIEELCENVTVMRAGRVVFDGTIDEMRAQAPAPSYRLRTSDDGRAVALAGTHPRVAVEPDTDDALLVRAEPADIDAYAIALGKADIAVRRTSLLGHGPSAGTDVHRVRAADIRGDPQRTGRNRGTGGDRPAGPVGLDGQPSGAGPGVAAGNVVQGLARIADGAVVLRPAHPQPADQRCLHRRLPEHRLRVAAAPRREGGLK